MFWTLLEMGDNVHHLLSGKQQVQFIKLCLVNIFNDILQFNELKGEHLEVHGSAKLVQDLNSLQNINSIMVDFLELLCHINSRLPVLSGSF